MTVLFKKIVFLVTVLLV